MLPQTFLYSLARQTIPFQHNEAFGKVRISENGRSLFLTPPASQQVSRLHSWDNVSSFSQVPFSHNEKAESFDL
jgi:hypothetical protein